MVPAQPNRADESVTENSSGFGTIINALIGGLAAIILSFIPFSPVLGGAIAGYLEGGTARDGLSVGAIAGLVMLVPFVFLGLFVLFFLGFGGPPAAFGIVAIFALLFAVTYTIVLSALGGFLGGHIRTER